MASGLNLMSELSCDTCCFFEPEDDSIGRVFGECRLKAPPFPTILDSSNMWCGEHSEIASPYDGEVFVKMPIQLAKEISATTHAVYLDTLHHSIKQAVDLALQKEKSRPGQTVVEAQPKRFWSRKSNGNQCVSGF